MILEIVRTWTRTLRHLRPIALNLSSHKTMNNTEITLDQLSEVAGSGPFAKIGDWGIPYRQIIQPQSKQLNMNRSLSRGGIYKAIEK